VYYVQRETKGEQKGNKRGIKGDLSKKAIKRNKTMQNIINSKWI